MSKPKRELEIKFALTSEQLERFKSLPALRGLNAGTPIRQHLRSIYFDTPDCKLKAHGYALRLRQDGKVWHQTVKAETGVNGGVSHPIEIEAVARGRKTELDLISDTSVRRSLRKLFGAAPPVPVFETVIERTLQPITTEEGCEVELALDKGVVKAGRRSTPICEAELELKRGTVEGLFRAVEQLFAGETLTPGAQNKSQLGYRLLEGPRDSKPEPLKAALPVLVRKDDCASALEQICRAAVHQILHNWQVIIISDDPEGPHQMRVGLRRLRSALAVFGPVLKQKALRDIETQLRDLARLVGKLRDADVLLADIVKPLAAHHGRQLDLGPLLELLERRCAAARTHVRERLSGPELSILRIRLALLPVMLSDPRGKKARKLLRMPVTKLAAKALQERWQKVAGRARRLEELTDEERHALRKDMKSLRYTAEFFAPLYSGRRVTDFISQLQRLQELFGYLNDVVVARALTRPTDDGGWQDEGIQRAIGFVIGWHTAHAEDTWSTARDTWRALKKARRFWD